MEFFERLYRGFEAEHYMAGKLFSIGYEAFMMPGDFGFDLMVTNQKERSKCGKWDVRAEIAWRGKTK